MGTAEAATTIEITAPSRVDFFNDPKDGRTVANAPFLYRKYSGDFSVGATIQPDFSDTYDAGTIFVWIDENRWIKLAFEFTDLGYPAVVSVVTDGTSDDANGQRIEEPAVRLKLSRKGALWGLHWAPVTQSRTETDARWRMIRYLRLGEPGERLRLGISVQSPVGSGCTVRFSEVMYSDTAPEDVRSGV